MGLRRGQARNAGPGLPGRQPQGAETRCSAFTQGPVLNGPPRSANTIFATGLQPYSDDARQPADDKEIRNHHLLALGYKVENLFPGIRGAGGAIGFFGERGIKWWKSSRSGDDTKLDGPTRNMASSQVACVNFLLPLAGIPGALTAALRALDGPSRLLQQVVYVHTCLFFRSNAKPSVVFPKLSVNSRPLCFPSASQKPGAPAP